MIALKAKAYVSCRKLEIASQGLDITEANHDAKSSIAILF